MEKSYFRSIKNPFSFAEIFLPFTQLDLAKQEVFQLFSGSYNFLGVKRSVDS